MGVEKDERGWPILYATKDLACDGVNPATGRACVVGPHRGYHRDEVGARWLDDGDLARPDWLSEVPDPRN